MLSVCLSGCPSIFESLAPHFSVYRSLRVSQTRVPWSASSRLASGIFATPSHDIPLPNNPTGCRPSPSRLEKQCSGPGSGAEPRTRRANLSPPIFLPVAKLASTRSPLLLPLPVPHPCLTPPPDHNHLYIGLPPLNFSPGVKMEEGQGGLPPPAPLEPISRPSSTSTTASHSHQQLPGISSIAAAAAAAAAATSTSSPPQMR